MEAKTITLRALTLVLRNLAIATGFVILLGRMYSLRYYEHLGIPISELDLGAVDYAIVSPAITVFGTGLLVVLVTFPMVEQALTSQELSARFRGIVGYSMMVFSYVVPLLALVPDIPSWIRGFAFALAIGASLHWGGTIASTDATLGKRVIIEPHLRAVVLQAVRVIFILLCATMIFLFTIIMAVSDAGETARTAPSAVVQTTSQDEPVQGRVILVGEKFIYLVLELRSTLQAIPVDRVIAIDYKCVPAQGCG